MAQQHHQQQPQNGANEIFCKVIDAQVVPTVEAKLTPISDRFTSFNAFLIFLYAHIHIVIGFHHINLALVLKNDEKTTGHTLEHMLSMQWKINELEQCLKRAERNE